VRRREEERWRRGGEEEGRGRRSEKERGGEVAEIPVPAPHTASRGALRSSLWAPLAPGSSCHLWWRVEGVLGDPSGTWSSSPAVSCLQGLAPLCLMGSLCAAGRAALPKGPAARNSPCWRAPSLGPRGPPECVSVRGNGVERWIRLRPQQTSLWSAHLQSWNPNIWCNFMKRKVALLT
jgi:hypothetical protein